MRLTHDQVRFFREAGYFKVPNTLPQQLIARLREVISAQMVDGIAPVVRSADGRVVRLSSVIGRDPVFLEALTSPVVLDPLESLLGPNLELLLNRHNHATITPKGLSQQRLHRDILQWSRSVVTALIYLEDATTDNGCTHVVPGSQYLPFVGVPNNGGTWMDEHEEYAGMLDQDVPIPMPEGGVLLLDSLVFHTVGTNATDTLRMSLAAGYHSVDELSDAGNDPKRLLVRGSRIYKGNDSYLR